jgi:hypothetical protein
MTSVPRILRGVKQLLSIYVGMEKTFLLKVKIAWNGG